MKNIIGVLLACIILNLSAFAGNYTWTGTTNTTWGTSTNWSPNGLPGSSDTININTTTNSLTLTSHQTVKRLVMNSGVLNLGGDTLTISTSTGLNGGTINNGLFDANCTALVNFNGTTFGAVVKAKGQIKLNGCVFNSTATFEHIGSSAGTGSGGNTFNGVTTLKNSGTTSLRLAGTNPDTFNSNVIIINASPSGSGNLQLSYGAATYFNGNIELSSTSAFGVSFSSQGDGSSTLATGKALSIGSAGFTGTLVMQNFTQLGSTAQTLSVSSVLNITNSTFNGAFTSTSTSILLSGCTFNNTSSFTKTGTAHDYSAGGNHFANNSTFTNSSSTTAKIRLAATSGDSFVGATTFNTTNGLIEVAYVDTTEFQGNVSINNSKVSFNNSTGYVLCSGGTSQNFSGSADYKIGKLIINKSAENVVSSKPMVIDSVLTLTDGVIFTDSINYLTLKNGIVLNGGSQNSYIDGPVRKVGNVAFSFPCGDNNRFLPLSISAPSNSTDAYTCQAISAKTGYSLTLDSTLMLPDTCSNWKLYRNVGSSNVYVTLSLDASSCLDSDSTNYRVATWNGSSWANIGNGLCTNSTVKSNVAATNYSSFLIGLNRIGNKCSSVIEVNADTAYTNNTFALTDSIMWFKFVADSSSTIVRIKNYGFVNPAILKDYYIYSGTCGSLTQIDSVHIFGPGDSSATVILSTTPDSTYYIKLAGYLSCSQCTQLFNGGFDISVTTDEFDPHEGNHCFDENGCGLGQNMGFNQLEQPYNALFEYPFHPTHLDHTVCTWLPANASPQLQSLAPFAPNSAVGDIYHAKMFSFDRSEIIYQNINFTAGETYVFRYYYRREPNLPAFYPNYTVVSQVSELDVYLGTNITTNSGFSNVTNYPGNWVTTVLIDQVFSISSTTWTYRDFCYTPTANYSGIAFMPRQSGTGGLSALNLDNMFIYNLKADAGADRSICLGSTTQLGAPANMCAISGETYSWSPSTGLSSTTIANPIFTPTTSGVFTFTLTVTDPNTNCSVTNDVIVTVNNLIIDLSATPPLICSGAPSVITAGTINGTAPYNYSWSNGATTNPITVFIPGLYTVTVTDDNGCIASESISISAANSPAPASISGSNTVCLDGGVDLPFSIVSPNSNYTYSWSSIAAPTGWNITSPLSISTTNQFSQTSGTSTLITFPNISGTNSNYLIQVITTDQNGCTSASIFPVNWCCESSGNTDHVWENESATNVTTPTNGESVLIRGIFNVDVNTTWAGIRFTMDPGAQIIVNPGYSLIIDQTVFSPCESFWKSILVNNSFVEVDNSIIEGAQIGIEIVNGGGYLIHGGSILRDNYISLKVTGSTNSYQRTINNSTITRSNSLYDTYTDFSGQNPPTCFGVGDAPQNGILLRVAGQITIGTNVNALPVIIENVCVGIESGSTNVTVINTDVRNLVDRPCLPIPRWSSSGVYTYGRISSTIINTPTPNFSTFDNCRTGIFTLNGHLEAINNVISNVTTGVRLIDPPSHFTRPKSIIDKNTITATLTGVDLSSTSGRSHHTQIDANSITALSGAPNGSGILVNDFIIADHSTNIHLNEINVLNNFRWGIRVVNFNEFSCIDNNIVLDRAGIVNGINTVGCLDFGLSLNTIDDIFSSNSSRGIHINTSGNSNGGNWVTCNDVFNCENDFYFNQSNLNVDWSRNEMFGGRTGLRLDNGTALFRNQPWNWWCGNFTNQWILTNGGSSANWIQDDVTSGTCITTPAGGQISGLGIFFIDAASSDPGCPDSFTPVVEITDQDRFIATDSNWSSMEENILWQYRRSLANKIVLHPDLLESDSTVSAFWESNQDLDEIGLAGLMKNVVLIDSVNKDYYGTLINYSDSISNNQIVLQYNDSLLGLNLDDEDSLRILEENIDFSYQISNWSNISDSLYSSFSYHRDIYKDSILILYADYNPGTERGEVEKEIWIFILNYGFGGEAIISSEDTARIIELSNLCMLDYGPAIGFIRSFCYSRFGIIVDDEDVCSSGERIRNVTNNSNSEKFDFTVFPNPAKSIVEIQSLNIADQDYSLSILNLQGVTIISKEVTSKSSYIYINELASGIYTIRLTCKEGSKTKKFVVLK